MKVAFHSKIEKRIRAAVKPGESYALDELTEEICGDDGELRREFSEVVTDEYHRLLSAMPREEMRELYRRCYTDESDANKDWLLGEVVESIEAKRN
jgi:uncharacterized protein CbrC (UPF0167 family)